MENSFHLIGASSVEVVMLVYGHRRPANVLEDETVATLDEAGTTTAYGYTIPVPMMTTTATTKVSTPYVSTVDAVHEL